MMTLNQQIRSIFELYGPRNAMYMRGDDRLLFLLNALRALGKHIRKEVKDKDVLAGALASVFSRACSYADSFVDLDVVGALQEKYPQSHCAYCLQMPCMCSANRQTDIRLSRIDGDQAGWTVGDWCAHIDRVYGDSNRERGVQFALGRLFEETCEAVDTQFLDTRNPEVSLSEARRRMAHEFADVFAWIFTMSLLLEVDIQPVLEERYNGACKRCGKRPCDCGDIAVNYLAGTESMRANSIVAH